MTDPEQVRRAAHDELVSTDGAWAGGEQAVTGFLRRVVADLHRTPTTVVEHAEFGHHGSGTSSFVAVSLARRDGDRADHLLLCLSRSAPFAALFTGTHGFPQLNRAAMPPVPGWERECGDLVRVLDRHGVELLSPPALAQPIDSAIRIDTFFTDRAPYTVFDAWFHWND